MNHESWTSFQEALKAKYKGPFFARTEDFERFSAFVKQLPAAERIPMLLEAYGRYRSLSVCGDPKEADRFEISFWSILVSTILSSGIRPNQSEATEILLKSYHRCGHGSDVEPPLTLAEKAYENQPYSRELFDAVLAYRETLRISRGSHAANVKRKLGWILWHDARRMEKRCHTRRIQQAIHSMDSERAFHWQWLLRNTAAGLNAAPGKNWLKEGSSRIAKIGDEQFLTMMDSWFTFPQQEIKLSPTGSTMLRLLVWYGALADTERCLPVLARLAHVSWDKRAAAGKVMGALSWMLRTHGGMRFEVEARLICAKWSSDSAEARRLEEVYFPKQSQIRKRADEESREQMQKDLSSQMEARFQALREQYPHIFGRDGFTAPEEDAAMSAEPPL